MGHRALWKWGKKLIPTVSFLGFPLHREVRMANMMAPTVRSNPSLGRIWWVDTGLRAKLKDGRQLTRDSCEL